VWNIFLKSELFYMRHNRDRMADYSAYPLAEPDVRISRIRLLCYYVSLSVNINIYIICAIQLNFVCPMVISLCKSLVSSSCSIITGRSPSLHWVVQMALPQLQAVLWDYYDFCMPSRWLRLSLVADTCTPRHFLNASKCWRGYTWCQVLIVLVHLNHCFVRNNTDLSSSEDFPL